MQKSGSSDFGGVTLVRHKGNVSRIGMYVCVCI